MKKTQMHLHWSLLRLRVLTSWQFVTVGSDRACACPWELWPWSPAVAAVALEPILKVHAAVVHVLT